MEYRTHHVSLDLSLHKDGDIQVRKVPVVWVYIHHIQHSGVPLSIVITLGWRSTGNITWSYASVPQNCKHFILCHAPELVDYPACDQSPSWCLWTCLSQVLGGVQNSILNHKEAVKHNTRHIIEFESWKFWYSPHDPIKKLLKVINLSFLKPKQEREWGKTTKC